jgi:transcriptional regulator with XRE-family HTH domain
MPTRHMTVKHEYDRRSLDVRLAVLHTMTMENVRTLRKLRKMSQKTLGELAGVDQAFISRIEKGEGNPSLDVIRALAAALKVSPGELFGFPELKRRTLAAMAAIEDPLKQEAAVTVLESMATTKPEE